MKKFFRKVFDNSHRSIKAKRQKLLEEKKATRNRKRQVQIDRKLSNLQLIETSVDAFDTFLFSPNEVTKGGVHIRDGNDLKRTMFMVVLPLLLLYLAGAWNIGHLHYHAAEMAADVNFWQKFLFGIVQILPIYVVTHAVGLGIEFLFAAKKGHGVEEGFLVTGALIPLIMPPTIPWWMVALATAFAVIFVKEAFGGTGMNVWNVALVSRAFVFFAYPAVISGDVLPILDEAGKLVGNDYVWIVTDHNFLHKLFGGFFNVGGYSVIDGYSGATPLAIAFKEGWSAVETTWSVRDLIMGVIPGSVGEMFKPVIILGAVWLLVTRIASWRIMLSGVLGFILAGLLFNQFPQNEFMAVPWYYHFLIGSFLFAIVFMATDPVTATQTNKGKWIYGFLIGLIGMIVRVINPAYPEGWMLAILFVNTFAPLIDHMIIQKNIKKRITHA